MTNDRKPKKTLHGAPLANGPGKGRPKGTPNKATQAAREVIQRILDNNAENAQIWLARVAKKDPKGALQAYIALLEFGVPKLQRTELTGKDGGPVEIAPSQADAAVDAARGKRG